MNHEQTLYAPTHSAQEVRLKTGQELHTAAKTVDGRILRAEDEAGGEVGRRAEAPPLPSTASTIKRAKEMRRRERPRRRLARELCVGDARVPYSKHLESSTARRVPLRRTEHRC